jgi:putative endonuclease
MRHRERFYVYILRCSTGEFYTGYTANLKKRIEVHNKGLGSKFTRGRLPASLVYSERLKSRKEAMRRERQIKRKSRDGKIQLINRKI